MRQLGTTDANTCAYNDFALVKVSAADIGKVNPSIPFWGGPTGIDTNGTAAGDRVYSYGNSSLRGGVTQLSPKTGISLGDDAADGGWSHPLYTLTPGIPGDSGSAFVSADGKAIGTLSTLGLAPLPLSNNIGDLAKELAFAQAHSGHRRPPAGQRHRAFRPDPLGAAQSRTHEDLPVPGSGRGRAALRSVGAALRRTGSRRCWPSSSPSRRAGSRPTAPSPRPSAATVPARSAT